MNLPAFFAQVPHIRLRDPLAAFLGAAEEGVVDYGYADVVKLAGHSCPTVASAYGMTRLALGALYGDELPQRGAVEVAFRNSGDAGVTGVMANVISMLTGAAGEGGFKGLAGRFARCGLLAFDADIPLEIRFRRRDTGAAVDAAADLRGVPGDPALQELMGRALAGVASPAEAVRLGQLWQDRVRRLLLKHGDDPSVFILRDAAPAAR